MKMNRRAFLTTSVAAAASCATASCATASCAVASPVRGKAEHVISIWLGGGMGQIDSFDPKRKGDPKERKPGSYYESIDTAVPEVQVCEHLEKQITQRRENAKVGLQNFAASRLCVRLKSAHGEPKLSATS